MSTFCVPFLIVNYGAEMIFILEQRLNAQSVKGEKSVKVLMDVSNALFSRSFLDELVRPQLLYSVSTTREIFDRLAQSSIMRLSETSMDKLYDLMTMGCKYQLVSCRVPRDIVRATLGHLEGVRQSLAHAPNAHENVDVARNAMNSLSGMLTEGQLADTRHSLLNFYHGKRIKISLLMQENLQNKDGSFILQRGPVPPADRTCPALPVGTIQYFARGSAAPTHTAQVHGHPDMGIEARPVPDNRLGRNLYTVERKKGAAPTASAAAEPVPVPGSSSPTVKPAVPGKAATTSGGSYRATSNAQRAAPVGKGHFAPAVSNSAAAVSTLTNLIVQNAAKETFKIHNLFDDGSAAATGYTPAHAASSSANDVIHIGQMSREEMHRANADLMSVMSGFNSAPSAPAPSAAGDDLLDLLDGA